MKQESEVNGVDISRIPIRDVYSFGLQLLEVSFTRKELTDPSVQVKKKSSKPGLPVEKVQQYLATIDNRFGDDWDLKKLTSKVNQMCRDTKQDINHEQNILSTLAMYYLSLIVNSIDNIIY